MPEPDEYLPIARATARAGLTEVALRRRIRRGDLAVYGDPRDLRVKLLRVADLDAYVAHRRAIPAGGKEGAIDQDGA